MMKEYITAAVIIILILLVLTQLKTDKKKISIETSNGKTINLTVEIADNPIKQMRGLMFRSSLPENEGMLFVFGDEQARSFWMANTTIPLDAIHIDSSGNIVDIIEMEPCKTLQCPKYIGKKPAKYVLEVNQGFSRKFNLSTSGSYVKID